MTAINLDTDDDELYLKSIRLGLNTVMRMLLSNNHNISYTTYVKKVFLLSDPPSPYQPVKSRLPGRTLFLTT